MKRFLLITWLMFSLSACTPPAAPSSPAAPAQADTPPAAITQPPPTPTPLPPTPTARPVAQALPPERQRVEFLSEDGVSLAGYYYPASVNPAPVVVLMHWAGGDQTDWLYVGMIAWLQNRGAEIPTASEGKPFDTPYAFPPLPEELSFAVFSFDFRGFGESSGKIDRDKLIFDARAAYQTAAGLEGVDPEKMIGIGASIGADAVVDACDACSGALSLGPGDWLGVPYPPAVKTLDESGKPVWCVAAEDTRSDLEACNAAAGEHYQKQIYPLGGHAMTLFRAELNLEPPIEAVILDFLEQALSTPQE